MTRKEYFKKRYENFKNNNKCVKCGKIRDGKTVLCESCRVKTNKYTNETRKFLQDMGICPRCRKNKLYGDEKVCPECNAKAYTNVINTRDRERYNELHRQWSKRQYEIDKANGICTRCRKRKAETGYVTCQYCRAKNRVKRENDKQVKRSERYLIGLCYFCDEPIKEGFKVCNKHYNLNVENQKKANRSVVRKQVDNSVL